MSDIDSGNSIGVSIGIHVVPRHLVGWFDILNTVQLIVEAFFLFYLCRSLRVYIFESVFDLLKLTGHVLHQQFNIQQLYVLPTLHLCVLYLSENKQRLVPLTA